MRNYGNNSLKIIINNATNKIKRPCVKLLRFSIIHCLKRYIIKKISTNVDSVFDKKIFEPLQKNYNKYIGQYYSPFSVKKLLDEIDILIDDKNIQFVEHNVETIVENDGIEIKFNMGKTNSE